MVTARGNSAAQYSTARTGNSKVRKHLTPNLTDVGCAKSHICWDLPILKFCFELLPSTPMFVRIHSTSRNENVDTFRS